MTGFQRIDLEKEISSQPILVSGQPVPALYESLISECRRRDAAADTSVFAEPVMGNKPGVIDWYGDPGSGEFVPWSALSDRQKTEARDNLRASIESIRGVKDGSDPKFDRLVDVALQVPSENDILVSNGRPLLVRWGMVPEGRVPDVSVVDRILAEEKLAVPSGIVTPLANENSEKGASAIRGSAVSTLLLSMTLTVLALTISGLLMLQNCGLAIPKLLTGGRTVMLANFCPRANDLYNPDVELLARLESEVQERVVACEPPEDEAQEDNESKEVTTPEYEEAIEDGVVEEVRLRIYDNTAEDGDVVTVEAPGYKRTITLTNAGETFDVPLVRGEMMLFGEHDGGGGITVSVALTDGTHIVDGSMKEGEQISLTIPQ